MGRVITFSQDGEGPDLTAREIMQPSVVSVSPETPLLAAHRLFVEEEIGGCPVVDDLGQVAGVVTSSDLLRAVTDEYDTILGAPDYFKSSLDYRMPNFAGRDDDFQDHLASRTVSEVMTDRAVCVDASAPIGKVARQLQENRIHRVLVVDGDRLIGIISTFDLVALLGRVTH